MGQHVYQHTLPNGMVLLAEPMDHVRSVAMSFLVPAGSAFDPDDQLGAATMLCELITRGAGSRDSRELSVALDNLGFDRDESVGPINMRFWGSTLSRNLAPSLEIYADILRRPHLPEEEFEPAQALAIQDIQSLEDSPQDKIMVELRRRYYPSPLNKDKFGDATHIDLMTIDGVRTQYQSLFRPNGTILSLAGNIDWPRLKADVERLFGDWKPLDVALPTPKPHQPVSGHITKETNQTNIAIAYPSAWLGHEDFYAAKGAASVLSGGMSSRLFTEVREKRGLCYSVYAFHETYRDRGTMIVYAGSRADRAQETLDVTMSELHRLRIGIEGEEVDRVKAGLKSSLIMQEESTSARAGAIASDWYYLGRVRSFEEVQSAIDGMSPAGILAHLERFPVKDPMLLTLGPKHLLMPG